MDLLRRFTGPFQLRRMPWALFAAAVLLSLIGALFIASAASAFYAKRHLTFLAVAVPVFFLTAMFDYRHLPALCVPAYLAGLSALAMLPVLGVTVNSARRWYDIGPVNLQPSEPMKYVVVVTLATYFAYRARLKRLLDVVVPLALVLPPMFLIARQPDLGSAVLFVPIFFAVAFVGGVPVRNLLILFVAGCLLAVAVWEVPGLIKPYQRDRFISFIDPDRNPRSSASYNARQATLAVVGGGLAGQGWGKGVLNRLRRVPERHTDFIFPVIAEEWGFFRTAAVVAFYLLVITLLGWITWQTPDPFGRMLAGGVMTVFAVQSLLHMAISLRLAPITGLTLPLMSYGGSSLVSTFGGFGLVASVAMRRAAPFADLHCEP